MKLEIINEICSARITNPREQAGVLVGLSQDQKT